MISNKNYSVDHDKFLDKKLTYKFAKETFFDDKASSKKSFRDNSLISLLRSPRVLVSASGVSNTKFLSSDPN